MPPGRLFQHFARLLGKEHRLRHLQRGFVNAETLSVYTAHRTIYHHHLQFGCFSQICTVAFNRLNETLPSASEWITSELLRSRPAKSTVECIPRIPLIPQFEQFFSPKNSRFDNTLASLETCVHHRVGTKRAVFETSHILQVLTFVMRVSEQLLDGTHLGSALPERFLPISQQACSSHAMQRVWAVRRSVGQFWASAHPSTAI